MEIDVEQQVVAVTLVEKIVGISGHEVQRELEILSTVAQ